jgi:hypothetical protein
MCGGWPGLGSLTSSATHQIWRLCQPIERDREAAGSAALVLLPIRSLPPAHFDVWNWVRCTMLPLRIGLSLRRRCAKRVRLRRLQARRRPQPAEPAGVRLGLPRLRACQSCRQQPKHPRGLRRPQNSRGPASDGHLAFVFPSVSSARLRNSCAFFMHALFQTPPDSYRLTCAGLS